MKYSSKTSDILEDVGSELKARPPSIVASTRKKFGPERARKQTVAILLNKSRRMGAKIPQSKSLGGK